MRILIDSANIEQIKQIYEYYPISGVTTNPTLLSQMGVDNPYDILGPIRDFICEEDELHVQVISRSAEDMVKEAEHIVNILGVNTYIKIPAVPEGFKAMQILLNESEIPFTATAIYTPMQAFMAAKCGASYVAPYINRIDNMGYNGLTVAKQIQNIINNNDMEAGILAASFKNSQQVLELCEYGIDSATIAPNILMDVIMNAAVNDAVETFIKDFESFAGESKTMLDFKEEA